jgi:hypothetical protein
MSEEEQMEVIIDGLYDEYVEGGFDFTTSQSLDDIFRMIFKDAFMAAVNIYESQEEGEEE